MENVIEVKPLDNFCLWIKFEDDFTSAVDIKPFINKGISSKLADEKYFKNVKIDEFGGISWENGFDFCPNFLREYISHQKSL
jgi:hypothetical protein